MATRKLIIKSFLDDADNASTVTSNTLVNGDCLKVMPRIAAGSIDLILTDPPYGTTACKWDSIIPLEPMWVNLKRLIKPNGAIVMTASQPFTTNLIHSNMSMFKYCWVWDKRVASNSQAAKYMPLKTHEDICVFGGRIKYNPQGLKDCRILRSNDNRQGGVGHLAGLKTGGFIQTKTGYPKSVQRFKPKNINRQHPTQKPVALMEYLIKTYTNKGDVVLDFTMGSGTTGVACQNLNRDFIGIELDKDYFNIACNRIHDDPELNAATLAQDAQQLKSEDFEDLIL